MARRKLDWKSFIEIFWHVVRFGWHSDKVYLRDRTERIRAYFCNNQRRLHRRFLRYIGTGVLAMLALANIFHFISWDDRTKMHREFLEMKQTAELSQTMLDARARIQITLIKTAQRRGTFIDPEKQMICSLWSEAQYDRTGEACPQ